VSAGTEIELRRLGTMALRLPRVALGCGNFGGVGSVPQLFGQGIAEAQAFELMDCAWELGITHFDTADAYGGGRSETTIGRWIASRGVRPTITTKTYNPMHEGGDFGLASERVIRQLDSSLERLGVEHVDLYLAHEFDADVPLEETFGAFESLGGQGKLGGYGVSNFDAAQLEAALAAGRPQAVQNERNLLQRQDDELLARYAAREVSYLAFGPLAGGWLTGKYKRDQPFPPGSRMTQRPEPYEPLVSAATFDALERVTAHAAEHGRTLAGLALAWLLDDGRVDQIVVGPNRPEHLGPLLEALANPLASGEREQIESLL
jgi:1-deoxyxylulose-5-phosphate synthase